MNVQKSVFVSLPTSSSSNLINSSSIVGSKFCSLTSERDLVYSAGRELSPSFRIQQCLSLAKSVLINIVV